MLPPILNSRRPAIAHVKLGTFAAGRMCCWRSILCVQPGVQPAAGPAEESGRLKALNTEVLGISVDSRHSSTAFAEHLKLDFPLLSDFSKEVTTAYGVLREGGFAERALFVIDKDGRSRTRMSTPSASAGHQSGV
jgi:hypothetical protein